ncbi:bifunctional RNase H/acid phosphatase [Rhizomonospora bruguierae]|uniref:bifunctional RNase H/acid phosphatase n=1 Tax=Rhizomonospora bruguierae TaxID=1581705 RepID=UPI0035E40994
MRVIVEADGGSRGNPGPAGYGALVRDAGTEEVLLERAEALGVTTNNVAEYSGLIAGLRAAAELGARDVTVRMDAKLVIEQMAGRWQIKNAGLRPLAAEAATLLAGFESVRLEWVPRERNRAADALANAAMDAAAGKPARQELVDAAPPSTLGATAAAPSWEPPDTPPTRLVLVRHGKTAMTERRRYSGRGDVPLSAAGRVQARAAARRVRALLPSITAVVSSPLSRCLQTAGAIAGDAEVTTDPDLIECDFGEWEGLTFAEARERWPGEQEAWLRSTAAAPPGGESFQAVAERVRAAAARIRAAHPGGSVVVVSHVSPIKLLLRDALAAGDAFLHRLYLDAAGVSVVDSWPDGNVAVRTVNDTAHLPELGAG